MELVGFTCPTCKKTKNEATLMKKHLDKEIYFATCLNCGSHGLIEIDSPKIKKDNNKKIII